MQLKQFQGDPLNWPEFIQNFKVRVHTKPSFKIQWRMESLLSA